MTDNRRVPVAPPSIDRAAADRVLSRALELQAQASSDPEGRLTEAQLETLAKEVGLDVVNLRQALAEERTRVEVAPERGVLAAVYGASHVTAQRVVRGSPSQVLKALDDWMQRQESLAPQRYLSDRIVWEARHGLVGLIQRAVSGRGHTLLRATTVAATVVSVDTDRVLVRLEAHFGGFRALMAQQSATLTAATIVAGGVLTVMSFPIIAAAAPLALVAPAGIAGSRGAHMRTVARGQLGLEQVLDRLERGDVGGAPSLIGMLAAVVGGKGRP